MARRSAGHKNASCEADFTLFVVSSRGSFKQNSMWQALEMPERYPYGILWTCLRLGKLIMHLLCSRSLVAMILLTDITALPIAYCQEKFDLPPAAVVQPDVPQGRIDGPHKFQSKLFPGTERQYWIYVPAQYDPQKPPGLMIVQDGLRKAQNWKLPTILDNLIHAGDIPVQLGVFVTPGVLPAAHQVAQPRYNRSYEYDGMTDLYARFLVEELLPEVRKTYTFSNDPNDRCVAGSSSGAICAFTAAWHRPDQFRRVFSGIGTYVGLRGGNEFPTLIRKTERKPIRIFLQDGKNDLDIYAGSWWHANQAMLSALQFAGYNVKHAWGDGGHNDKHGAAVMPEALRWLWRDYPLPVDNIAEKTRRRNLLIDGEDWELVSNGYRFTEGPAVNSEGLVYFSDIPNNRIHRINREGEVTVFADNTEEANGLMFGPDGKLYACESRTGQVVRYTADGSKEQFLQGIKGNDIVVLYDGSGYITEPSEHRVWQFTADGKTTVATEGIEFPNGVIVSPDQTLLTVTNYKGRFCLSYRIQPDGSLAHEQEYGWLHVNDHLQSHADGMTIDTIGHTYVATSLGVQVLDQTGRVNFIIRKPQPGALANVVLAGSERNILYATCGDSVYKRRINATGVDLWKRPVNAPKPRL